MEPVYFGHGENIWPEHRIRTRYFPIDSIVDNWGNTNRMYAPFILALDEARHIAKIPFLITSGFRETGTAHGYGLAVDIRCHSGRHAHIIEHAARQVGISRRGIYNGHVHLDMGNTRLTDHFPANVLWSGISQTVEK